MRLAKLGGLAVRITGGEDGSGSGDGPLVVFFHGFGAPGDDLVPLAGAVNVPEGTRFAFPAAPVALQGMLAGGRAWWMIDPGRFESAIRKGQVDALMDEEPEGLAPVRKQATTMLDELQAELGVGGSRMVLGGFSQGSMLAVDLALSDSRPLAGLVIWSGTFLSRPRWREGMKTRAELPVLQSHGKQDPLLPFSIAEHLRDALGQAQCEVTWVPFSGGHEIPGPVLAETSSFLQRTLG